MNKNAKLKTQDAKRQTRPRFGFRISDFRFDSSFIIRHSSFLRTLHQDTRGTVSLLVLLTIWSLVAILGLVWNTTEQSKRRAEIQTAADSAAHSAATWMARAVNAIDAQNMLISQDASTEIIWRTVSLTDGGITNRLNQELAQATTTKRNLRGNSGLSGLSAKMQQDLTIVAREYQLTLDQINTLNGGLGANYADPQEQLDTLNHIRQARSALNWINDVYVNGAQPPPPPVGPPPGTQRPGPPGPNGEGLKQLATLWNPQNEDAILDVIINFINSTEKPILAAFENRTAPATAQPVDAQMAAHESQIYQTELAMADQVADTIETQRAQLAAFYKTDITLATLKNNSAGSAGGARITAPLIPASQVQSITQPDLIRVNYLLQGFDARSPIVTIDPFNSHTDDNIIWHPDAPVFDNAGISPVPLTNVTLNANIQDGWGHIWAMPLERYIYQRVGQDQQDLNVSYMQPLDLARMQTLASTVRLMMGLPAVGDLVITPLPGMLPDDQLKPYLPVVPPPPPALPPPPPPKIYEQIPVLPRLTAPVNASAAYRTAQALYLQHAAAYTGAVDILRSDLTTYTAYFSHYTEAFAQKLWEDDLNISRRLVMKNLGEKRQFMVLSSYALHYIPDWAKPGMFTSAQTAIEDQLVIMNIDPVTQKILDALIDADQTGVGMSRDYLRAKYLTQATAIADAVIRPTAHQVSLEIAAEWINRPWPFEITPPADPVLPNRGVTAADRMREFSLLAAARQTDATAPHLLLPDIFGNPTTKLTAYAQAEAFNWMEFNADYGASERFDQVVYVPEVTFYPWYTHHFVGAPRGWRTGTLAGWDWRARLSLSDALAPALQNNPELLQYLNDAGITNPVSGALNEINLH